MESTVTEADLAARLTDVLDRVHGGERFVVKRDGQVMAVLHPPHPQPGITPEELVARIGDLPMPGDGFADDLEAIQAAQRPATLPQWPD